MVHLSLPLHPLNGRPRGGSICAANEVLCLAPTDAGGSRPLGQSEKTTIGVHLYSRPAKEGLEEIAPHMLKPLRPLVSLVQAKTAPARQISCHLKMAPGGLGLLGPPTPHVGQRH